MASFDRIIHSSEVEPLVSQVGGHAPEKDKLSPGMLKHKDGFVLKPVPKPVQAMTEIEFYKGLATGPQSAIASFAPKFFGTAIVSLDCYTGTVIILEDVAESFKKPCIMDVKIGRQTWDPFASASKIEAEEKKYKECKRDFGFCIPGFQVYNAESGELRKFDKKYGRTLNNETILNAFTIFLNLSHSKTAKKVIDEFLCKLHKLYEILIQQTSLHLYSSSILLTYDCEQFGKDMLTSSFVRVHMVDFAHSYTGDSHEKGPDKNYLEGLKGLIKVLTRLKG